jgi:dTDP-4-dehydrorhamnose 3,5-epimerase
MAQIVESDVIPGVKFAKLRVWVDDRGRFLETFRTEWFPERSWDTIQTNCSYSHANVLRGLHYHRQQVDYWFVPSGLVRIALVDVRRSSRTWGASQVLQIGDGNPLGVFVPTGIAHGFLALTDAILSYVVDNYYDGNDEFGVAWDDPDLALDWGVADPILSPRDRQNPLLKEIPAHQMAE